MQAGRAANPACLSYWMKGKRRLRCRPPRSARRDGVWMWTPASGCAPTVCRAGGRAAARIGAVAACCKGPGSWWAVTHVTAVHACSRLPSAHTSGITPKTAAGWTGQPTSQMVHHASAKEANTLVPPMLAPAEQTHMRSPRWQAALPNQSMSACAYRSKKKGAE